MRNSARGDIPQTAKNLLTALRMHGQRSLLTGRSKAAKLATTLANRTKILKMIHDLAVKCEVKTEA